MKDPYECIIIGAGIAGLQAAIQLGRYTRRVLVIDSGSGRSTLCRSYHNILGWPEGVSGQTLRELGKEQAERSGIHFLNGRVTGVKKAGSIFHVETANGEKHEAMRILLATGLTDRLPDLPNLLPCLGISIYVCPDCDGYEVQEKKTLILGSGTAGANLALTLTYWTSDLIYINHEKENVPEEIKTKLDEKGIVCVEEAIASVLVKDPSEFIGVKLSDGRKIYGERAFTAFGGNTVHSELAGMLGAERLQNKHVVVNPRTKETSVQHVWAAGDIGVHSEQVTIAMGDGCQAAIWIHKSLL
ncbi:NAD(P)/FAD-dependent oxidoreductase [Metabacillus idriensis]|uniref:NAD(P)-binding protein n=1 Tax=Metabacillus idriensis TaxID=324768 RepID=A0A6I2MEX4_9BACI|nr:NAD(P)/FAD-dependent oxidoreductase [Metabacillus idriensis]MCM3597843.1 NAD(P)/FAD-dependent oxidoreductase [Metabacillus idriensis]MRX56329.1 NAD(P)-binding protein [Metabacillus idriensis]OHR70619.1 pyridine nucleotide-disulfide oxidoreductase [Bacillus sp. HMSC76G11]